MIVDQQFDLRRLSNPWKNQEKSQQQYFAMVVSFMYYTKSAVEWNMFHMTEILPACYFKF